MFDITTVAHKCNDLSHPLVMLTNREGQKYLFGKIPEGSQRVLNEYKIRMGKLKAIYLTGTVKSWSEIGGLPGLFLTISDSTKKSIDLFANSNKILSYVVATWRYFVFRKGVELNIIDTEDHKMIGDSNLIITPIRIQSNYSALNFDQSESNRIYGAIGKLVSLMFPMDVSKVNDPNPSSYKSDPSENDIQTHVKLPHPFKLEPTRTQKSISYMIRFLPIRGKFDPVKAKSLGVKPGVEYRKLTMGESVTNVDGNTVYPEQVIGESKSFKKLLILDIPDNAYLFNTVLNPVWFEKNTDSGPEDTGIVYHLLGDDIDFMLQDYLQFIQKFPSDCQHVISHSSLSNETLIFKTAAVNLIKLKCLQRDNFNLPIIDNYKPLDNLCGIDHVYKLQHLQKFNISTSGVEFVDDSISTDTWSSLYDEAVEPLNLSNISKQEILSDKPLSLELEKGSLKDQVQIATLGTGSALPSIHRNVISTLARIPYKDVHKTGYRSILLDGGENTLGSLFKCFGHDNGQQLKQILQELSLIHLSHLHADHHLGIISIINKWFEVNRDPKRKLYVITPWQYDHFMREWYAFEGQKNELCDPSRIVYFNCEDFLKDKQPPYKQLSLEEFEKRFDKKDCESCISKEASLPVDVELINELYRELGLKYVKTVRAIHCYWSYSITLNFSLSENEDFKLSYSGDTRPNPKFGEVGAGSDLLIHESSLDQELIEEAISKKHSTMIEALTVAKKMNCNKVILTHFSTRYSNKANLLTGDKELEHLADELNKYLTKYGVFPNIFQEKNRNQHDMSYSDIDTCFAFDLMIIRLKDIHKQKFVYKDIIELFQDNDEDASSSEKREKELKKQREKRDFKRLQRLASKNYKKKRRVSSDEESV